MFPDSPDDEIDFSTKLYAIKLAEPTSEGGQGTASTPIFFTVGLRSVAQRLAGGVSSI